MNTDKNPEFSAYIGIDWADTKHDVCIQVANNPSRTFSVIEHKVEKIDEWVKTLRAHYPGTIAIAVEISKGPIVYALQKYDCFVIFPINPAVPRMIQVTPN